MHDCQCMTLKKINIIPYIIDNSLNYRQPHQHIYLKEKKKKLYYNNSKLIEKLNIKIRY